MLRKKPHSKLLLTIVHYLVSYTRRQNIGSDFQQFWTNAVYIQVYQKVPYKRTSYFRNAKKVLLGIFEFTYSVIWLKSESSTGSLSCDATFTQYLLNTFAISFSSESNRSFSFSPSIVFFAPVLRDAPISLKIFQIVRGSSLPFSILVLYILFLANLIIEETLFLNKTYLLWFPFILHLFLSLIVLIISGVSQSGWWSFLTLCCFKGTCLLTLSKNNIFHTCTHSFTSSKVSKLFQGICLKSSTNAISSKCLNDR